MNKQLIYDIPVRLFHWLFAASFITSFTIGKWIDDESTLYAYHMISGLFMTSLVILRILWGIIGTKYSQFKHFELNPQSLINYIKGLLQSKSKIYTGHNPASSWASLAMFGFSFALTITGLLMVNKINKHTFEEVHEVAAHLFALTVILHIAGVIFHQIKHRDLIALSMVTGHKNLPFEDKASIASAWKTALVFILLCLGILFSLNKNYDTQSGQLHIFGQTLQLGETEENEPLQQNNESQKTDAND